MAVTKQQLQRAKNQAYKARESKLTAFRNRLDRFLFINIDEIIGKLETGDISGLEAANILGQLKSNLEDLGLQDELERLVPIYKDELDYIETLFELGTGKKILYSGVDADVIDQLINFDIEATRGQVYLYADKLKSTLMQSVLTGEAPDTKQLQRDLGDSALNNIETEVNTSLAGFSRSVTINKAKEAGLDLFIYIGPDDNITRPFCQSVLDRSPAIYTIDEIKDLDNGQGLDVFTYAGGYNCRHEWSPLSADAAAALGYQSDN